MKRSGSTGQRLAALFLLGCVALNYPVLSLFRGGPGAAGIPPLYAWVFGSWAVLVVLMALAAERSGE